MDLRSMVLFLLLVRSCSSQTTSGFYFLRVEFHELDGYVISVERVYDDFECILRCGRVYECQSVNYAIKPGVDGLCECLMLKYRAVRGMYGPLKPSHNFHYYYKDKDCDKALGLEDRTIPDSAMTASSNYYDDPKWATYARLHKSDAYGWAPAKSVNSDGEWLQVDLGKVMAVAKVATQGRPKKDKWKNWITKYSISSSVDQNHWLNYTENGMVKVFDGNYDKDTVVTNSFKEKIVTRYVRLIVKAWDEFPELRMELYGCEFP